jgi:hypothetical protein
MITGKLILIYEARENCDFAGELSNSHTRIEVDTLNTLLPYVLEQVRHIIAAAGWPISELVGINEKSEGSRWSSEEAH